MIQDYRPGELEEWRVSLYLRMGIRVSRLQTPDGPESLLGVLRAAEGSLLPHWGSGSLVTPYTSACSFPEPAVKQTASLKGFRSEQRNPAACRVWQRWTGHSSGGS